MPYRLPSIFRGQKWMGDVLGLKDIGVIAQLPPPSWIGGGVVNTALVCLSVKCSKEVVWRFP